jgi:hypothetical protein
MVKWLGKDTMRKQEKLMQRSSHSNRQGKKPEEQFFI